MNGQQAPNIQYAWSPATFLDTTGGNIVNAQKSPKIEGKQLTTNDN